MDVLDAVLHVVVFAGLETQRLVKACQARLGADADGVSRPGAQVERDAAFDEFAAEVAAACVPGHDDPTVAHEDEAEWRSLATTIRPMELST